MERSSSQVQDTTSAILGEQVKEPDDVRFKRLKKVASELTEGRVTAQLNRMESVGVVSKRYNWDTSSRHLIVRRAMERAKRINQLVELWPYLQFSRGNSLGNHDAEIMQVVSFCIIMELDNEYLRWLSKKGLG